MRVALVRSGKVENVAEVGEHYAPPAGLGVVPHATANIGDKILGDQHIPAHPPGDERQLLVYAVERKARNTFVDDASLEVQLHPSDVWVDVRLGRFADRLHAARVTVGDSAVADRSLFRRSFAVVGGSKVYTVTMTWAELRALDNVIVQYQEAVEKAAADIIDEVYSGRVTRGDQVDKHPAWPSRRVSFALRG